MAHKVTDECVACGACVDTCPLALSALRTRPLSMLLLVLTAVLAKVLAPLVQSSRNNHSVPNPLCSVCCAGDFLMQKFIGQHHTIPALRLKHRSDGCGTASALPKCSIMSGCGTRIVLRGKSPSHSATAALLRFAVSATGGAHLCSIQYYLRFWPSSCRTSLAVSALRIMRYCLRNLRR